MIMTHLYRHSSLMWNHCASEIPMRAYIITGQYCFLLMLLAVCCWLFLANRDWLLFMRVEGVVQTRQIIVLGLAILV